MIGKVELIVTSGPFRGRRYLLNQETISIGRRDENDIVIPDMTVSRKHATLFTKDDAFWLRDDSENGTVVDGQRETECQLNDGARIEIGPVTFSYVMPLPHEDVDDAKTIIRDQPFEDFDKTIVHHAGDAGGHTLVGNQLTGAESADTAESSDDTMFEFDSPTSIDAPAAASEEEEEAGEEKSLLGSPVAKIAAGVVILFGLLYLLLPQEDQQNGPQSGRALSGAAGVEVKVPNWSAASPPTADDLAMARSMFKAAEKYHSEKVRNVNLYEAITRWESGIELLAKYRDRPPEFTKAVQYLGRAKKELQERFEMHRRKANLAEKQRNWDVALQHISLVLESIPNHLDPRYVWAKQAESRIMLKRKQQ